MLVLAFVPMPYGYYQLLRFVVSITSGIIGYKIYNETKSISYKVILWTLVLLLYNPLIRVHLEREIWQIINIITILIITGYLWIIRKKPNHLK